MVVITEKKASLAALFPVALAINYVLPPVRES